MESCPLPEPINTLLSESWEDLRRRYRGGFFLWKNKKDVEEPVVIEDFDSDSQRTVYFRRAANHQDLLNESLHTMRIREVYPDKGLYNHISAENEFKPVFMFGRASNRQWAHGIRGETTRLEFININMFDSLHRTMWRGVKIYHSLVVDLFNPWYPKTWEHVLESLKRNPIIAMSSDFGVMYNFFGPNFLVFKYNQYIGYLKKDEKRFILHEPLFAQELSDLIKRKNFDCKIELT